MERLLRIWSPFGIIEVTYTILPWWALAATASFFWRSKWLDVITVAGALYLLSAAALMRVARWWSRHTLGLRRYIAVPIPRWLAVALIRGRMALPAGRRYFLLHVRVEQGVDLRRMAREMAGDVRRAVESEWARGAVFVGCTFGALGTRQKRLLEQYGEVVAVPGTFLPAQTLLLRPKGYQKKMFGRRWSQGQWQVVKFQVNRQG
ncbi:MAG TPA: hypothetical protein GX517_12415 [Alicyclobacillus sp.]|nr:hypothetical protein [Alicyclobacillus sp.]